VEDEDYFGQGGTVEGFFYDGVAGADVVGCVVEIALDEALEDVEEDSVSWGCQGFLRLERGIRSYVLLCTPSLFCFPKSACVKNNYLIIGHSFTGFHKLRDKILLQFFPHREQCP